MREPAAAVERVNGACSRRGTGTTTACTPSSPVEPAPGRPRRARRPRRPRRRIASRRTARVGAVEIDRRRDRGGIERAARLGDGERAGELARGDGAEEAGLLLGGAGLAHGGDELRDRREERPGGDDPPDLLGEDAGFDHAETDAAVASGTVRPGQPSPVIVAHSASGRSPSFDDRRGRARPGSPCRARRGSSRAARPDRL